MIDKSQRNAARVWAITYLIAFACVIFANFAVHERLTVSGDAAATARNIAAHEQLFRAGLACDLVYCIGLVVALSAVYVILAPVNRHLAFFGALCVFVYASMWIQMTLRQMDLLRLKGAAQLGGSFDRYYVGLIFYGIGMAVLNSLWFKSGYVPRALAAFGVAATAWCAACSFTLFIVPDFPKIVNLWWFDTPMGLFEITMSVWLLVRGLRPVTPGLLREPLPVPE